MNVPQSFKQNKGFLAAGIPLILAAILLSGFLWLSESVPPALALVSSQRAPIALGNESVITIGVAADMSSPAKRIGWREVNAAQLAIDKINAAGGVEIGDINYTLNLVSADSGCDPTQGLSAANTLLNAGAVAVVGHTCSAASNAAQPLYAAAGVPMVSPSATWPPLTEQGYTTTFRVIPRDDSPPAMLAAYMRNHLAYQRAAIVEMEGFFYNDWIKGVFSDTFTSLGGEITSHNTVSSSMDFTATLTTIMAENPDAIFFGHDDSGTAGLLSKVAHNLGMSDVAIGWATFSSERSVLDGYASTAGVAAEGDIAILYGRDTDNMPGYSNFNAAYLAAGFTNYGDEAQVWGAFAYDALQIIVAAIERAGSLNPADIRDEIAATTHYQGVVGAYRGFDDKGDVIPQWAWMEQYQDGHWSVIWPYRVHLPIVMGYKKSGERINIFDSGPQTFAEKTPFHIAHGFVFEPTDQFIELNDFRLQVDGVYRDENFIEEYLDESFNPPSIHKSWVFNFPGGMQGVHTLTGHWLAPCVQVYDDCAVPEEIIETRVSLVEVTFVP